MLSSAAPMSSGDDIPRIASAYLPPISRYAAGSPIGIGCSNRASWIAVIVREATNAVSGQPLRWAAAGHEARLSTKTNGAASARTIISGSARASVILRKTVESPPPKANADSMMRAAEATPAAMASRRARNTARAPQTITTMISVADRVVRSIAMDARRTRALDSIARSPPRG